MRIQLSGRSGADNYRLLTQTVLPRPIAWILSQNANGTLNLAPFSYFTAVASDPPMVAVSIGTRTDGSPKDSRENILAGRPFVIHLGSVPQAKALNQSSASLPPGVSELTALGLETVPFEGCPIPRLKGAKVAYHARYQQHVLVGEKKQALILAELLHAWLDDDCVIHLEDDQLAVDPVKLEPLARLGGNAYTTLGKILAIDRPH